LQDEISLPAWLTAGFFLAVFQLSADAALLLCSVQDYRTGSRHMQVNAAPAVLQIRAASVEDCALIHSFIMELAVYEKLAHEVVATPEVLAETLFGPRPGAEVLIAEYEGRPVGYALFFQSFSTFLGRPGLYLEDVYVQPALRGRGIGKAIMTRLAALAVERSYARFEWSVLDWNEPSIQFYRSIGAVPMEGWTVQRLTGQALLALAAQDGSAA
jgi:GNAT superfamily N-acetyltransferase